MCFVTWDLLSSQEMALFQILRQQQSYSLKVISLWCIVWPLPPSHRRKIIYSRRYTKRKEIAVSAVARKQKLSVTLKIADQD